MSPRAPDRSETIIRHDHTREAQGGDLPGFVSLARTSAQTLASSLVVEGDLRVLGGTELSNINLDADATFTWVRDGFIHTLDAVTTTDGRTWSDPDATGTRVVSRPIVTRSGKSANDSGTIISGPEVGLYLVAWYLEITTAALVGAISLDIISTGAGGAITQSELSGLSLTSKTARSGLALVYMASGDVTFATTLTAGSPVYDLRFVPIGRVA